MPSRGFLSVHRQMDVPEAPDQRNLFRAGRQPHELATSEDVTLPFATGSKIDVLSVILAAPAREAWLHQSLSDLSCGDKDRLSGCDVDCLQAAQNQWLQVVRPCSPLCPGVSLQGRLHLSRKTIPKKAILESRISMQDPSGLLVSPTGSSSSSSRTAASNLQRSVLDLGVQFDYSYLYSSHWY